jgi:hypothetical protein
MTYTGFRQLLGIVRQFFRPRPVSGKSGGGLATVAAINASRLRNAWEQVRTGGNIICGVIKPTANRRSNVRQ